MEAVATAVEHGPLGVVHRSCSLADEGYLAVVVHLVPFQFGPPHLFEAEDALEVEHIGVGAVEACRLEGTVEVDHEVVFGAHLGCAAVEVGDYLVVAVHKVDLEPFDAHLAVVLTHPLHVAVEGIVARPEDDAYVALLGIVDQHGQVYLRHHLEKVGFAVHRPPLVKDDVFDAIA